ncbi:MAG: 5-amino-6-(D-ribitylamino)uracil--L-tyrosine 4-hydroxyphenyl transferase CofH [Methanosarcinales archaeon]|nr:5-amino-6-(D-ribitylamino)uracil--L-tyrosine 4-hydroxyphenyl transferase CofH [Methanosarcinales archaeon]
MICSQAAERSVLSDSEAEGGHGQGGRESLLALWREPLRLFRTARQLCRETCGDEVSFVVNRNINFTNVCVGRCKFCAFRRVEGFRLTDQQILDRVASADALGATELCIQGGLAPGMVVEDYCHILELISSDYPRIHLHAFSPMEVLHMAGNSGVEVAAALLDLKAAGLGSMPGTAAEILVDEVRRQICPTKMNVAMWREVITTAHRLGIPTTSTMLYGHVESFQDRLAHLEILREIQGQTRGITEFILLPLVPWRTELAGVTRGPDLLENLKMHALARVALHPLITNVQSSWVKLGREAAGATLEWGVNDLGGTLMEDHISHSAGSTESQYISADELCEIIERHGRVPVQRTTLYQRV